jgi:hypothetical protein
MGKGWAKGLTKATDARVARAAEAHRGTTYAERSAATDMRKVTSFTVPDWSAPLAYVVGLTATDGCLISGRRQINFKSADRDLVALYLSLLGRTNQIGAERTRTGGVVYKTQFGDAALYRWLTAIGLGPRKSLTLGALAVPDEYLFDVVRGLLDGDGTIINHSYRADTGAKRPYLWEYLITRFCSASRDHLDWLATRLRDLIGISGAITGSPSPLSGNTVWSLSFSKRPSVILLGTIYRDADAPCLNRKRRVWLDYAARHNLTPIR